MQHNYQYDLPENYYFGGGAQESVITPIALLILVAALALIFIWPRRRAMIPILVAGIMLPAGINLVVFGFHLPVLRLLVGITLLRFVLRGELAHLRWNMVDAFYVAGALCNAIAYSILWGSSGAVVNRIGYLWTVLGTYLIVRVLIRGKEDIVLAIRTLAVLCFIIGVGMTIEHATQYNVFSLVGGVQATGIRAGSFRALGPFQHSIIAGTIGAMLLPMFIGLFWQERKNRAVAALGIVASVLMTISSASATPIMTLAFGVLALCLWKQRDKVRLLRWAFLLSLIVLQLTMKAPVWFLISRAGGVLGGSGYHRAMLIDGFVRHFNQWWMIGTRDNSSWGYDMWDVDNAFVAAGVQGGFLAFVLFVALIAWAFKRVRLLGLSARRDASNERLVWAIGCCIFSNVIGFFGIVYWDQSILIWCLVLAFVSISSMSFVPEPVKLNKWSKWQEDYRKRQQPDRSKVFGGVKA